MGTFSSGSFTKNSDTKKAATELVSEALKQLGGKKPQLAILYSTPKHDANTLVSTVRAGLGKDVRLIGGPAYGVIGNNELGYNGFEAGLYLFTSDEVKFEIVVQEGLYDRPEIELGREFGKKLLKSGVKEAQGMLLFYDSLKPGKKPFVYGVPILEGTEEVIGKWPPMAGVGMMGNIQFVPQQQWIDDRVFSGAIVGLMFFGPVRADHYIFHGCLPSTDYHTITKVDGPVIQEIDGKPAITRVMELLGPDSGITPDNFPLFLLFGYNTGDKYADFNPELYANRLCLAVDKEKGTITLFEPDLKVGDEVQLMRSSVKLEYMQEEAKKFLGRIPSSATPFFASYINCIGRGSAMSRTETEEAAEIQKVIANKFPLLGCYSGVEIAKVGEDYRPLDWTGVLSIFSVSKK